MTSLALVFYSLYFFLIVLSPPMSPTYGCRDEAAHVCSIIEGVCQTQDIGKNAVKALCSHVHADQEEEEVLHISCVMLMHIYYVFSLGALGTFRKLG